MVKSKPKPQDGRRAAQQPVVQDTRRPTIVYVIGLVVVLLAIAVLLLVSSGGGSGSSTTISPQSNSTPIYMNTSAAEALLGSKILNYSANYSAASLYNYSSPVNMTLLEAFLPALSGNATNGWVTLAVGSDSNNASIEYYAIQTANAPTMSALFAQAVAAVFPTLPTVAKGTYGGMNYTYETYTNRTGGYQSLVGWKDGYVLAAEMQANRFTSNQTQIARLVSATVP